MHNTNEVWKSRRREDMQQVTGEADKMNARGQFLIFYHAIGERSAIMAGANLPLLYYSSILDQHNIKNFSVTSPMSVHIPDGVPLDFTSFGSSLGPGSNFG